MRAFIPVIMHTVMWLYVCVRIRRCHRVSKYAVNTSEVVDFYTAQSSSLSFIPNVIQSAPGTVLAVSVVSCLLFLIVSSPTHTHTHTVLFPRLSVTEGSFNPSVPQSCNPGPDLQQSGYLHTYHPTRP